MAVIFETERTRVREWEPEKDAAYAYEIYGDPEVTRYLGGKPTAGVAEQGAALKEMIVRYRALDNGTGAWAVEDRESGKPVGTVLLKQLPGTDMLLTNDYEVGWHLKRSHWGRGLATEVGRAALDHGFRTLKMKVIYAVVLPANQRSIGVISRLGMISIGRTNRYYGGLEVLLYKMEKP